MAKLVKIVAVIALLGGAMAMTPGTAQAHWHGGWHGGWHHRGGWGWGPFGLGIGLGYGWGYPYYYAPYYAAPRCGWSYYRVWRYRHWVLRRAWRCW